jgi:hypothetical protein
MLHWWAKQKMKEYMALRRSLVNARGASYSLVFRAIFIKTIDVNVVVNDCQFWCYILLLPYVRIAHIIIIVQSLLSKQAL